MTTRLKDGIKWEGWNSCQALGKVQVKTMGGNYTGKYEFRRE